jgi:hypothetical protein
MGSGIRDTAPRPGGTVGAAEIAVVHGGWAKRFKTARHKRRVGSFNRDIEPGPGGTVGAAEIAVVHGGGVGLVWGCAADSSRSTTAI